ncbi:MAG: hypothetical protein F6J94_29290 [Moorea sp. SIO1F2]|uniref:hypothetical protein n=1 Tax=Moorena sp. SIO1F2 TaxID=2607819 RepID=UPI0013BA20A6|nr:hypothetical protein [Moorena sp. SIO1F2]NET85837.1 hypothetical protein [Moorena sp. SIO1F2]
MNIDSSFLANFATSLIYDSGVLGSRESGIGSREWGDGEMGRWGDGEMGRSFKGNYPEMI